jgi:hypothetical protein
VTSATLGGSVRSVADTVFPGDLNPGDVIALPDATRELIVKMVRLGRGGFLITVSESSTPTVDTVVVLTTWTPVERRRVAGAQLWPGLPVSGRPMT